MLPDAGHLDVLPAQGGDVLVEGAHVPLLEELESLHLVAPPALLLSLPGLAHRGHQGVGDAVRVRGAGPAAVGPGGLGPWVPHAGPLVGVWHPVHH